MDGLRAESHMPHHRNPGGGNPGDDVGLTGSALEFHGLAAGLLEKSGGRLHCRPHAKMLERKRQIDDDKGPRHGSGDDLSVVDHLLQRRREGGRPAGHDHRHAVAHEHAVHPRGIG